MHCVRGEVRDETVIGGGAGGAHAAHPHGHLELLQLLRDVRHVRRAHLVPERGQQLVHLLILLPRRRHHVVLGGAHVAAAPAGVLVIALHDLGATLLASQLIIACAPRFRFWDSFVLSKFPVC